MPELLRCPTCGQLFDRQHSRAMPFCSSRCRQIDLGRWLNEEIGLPIEPEDRSRHNHADEQIDENDNN